jgi:hypothetical protein
MTAIALILDPTLSFERFESLIAAAGGLGDAARWILGDLVLFSEARYGERHAQAIEASRLSERQLNRYRWVCERVARSRRRENLPFSYHEEVAPLEPATQEKLLALAEDERWSREQLREAVRDVRASNGTPPKTPPARQEVLDAPAVDAAAGLVAVRETLTLLNRELDGDAAEAIGLPRAMRALDVADAAVKRTIPARAPERPPMLEAARRVVGNATLSGGFYMVEQPVFQEFAAAVAASAG